MDIRKIESGIPGLDKLIVGGIPSGATILISGSPGTGKTLFGLQSLCHGAMNREPGIYVTFEQSEDSIKKQIMGFGWGKTAEAHIKNDLLRINCLPLTSIANIEEKIKKEVEDINAKRLVIDSLSTIAINASEFKNLYDFGLMIESESKHVLFPPITEEAIIRRVMHTFIRNIKELGVTAIFMSELPKESNYLSRDTVSEFVCDGVILLQHITGGTSNRTLVVEKMRQVKIDDTVHPLKITDDGILVLKQEELYK